MFKTAVAIFVSLVAVALLAVPGLAKLETAEMTTAAVIQDAYDRGNLDYAEMMLQKAYALYAPEKVRADLVGGMIDKLARRPVRKAAYNCASWCNKRHMRFAWFSLVWVAFTDVYVRLCAMGIWTDWRIF